MSDYSGHPTLVRHPARYRIKAPVILCPALPAGRRPRWRHGLTLIELLVAITIAVLLVSVVFLVYSAALNTIRTQTAWRELTEPADDALDALQRDLQCSLILRGVTNASFVLHPADNNLPEKLSLRLMTAWPGNGSNDWRTYGIREVEYSLRAQSPTAEGYALIRRSRPFRIAPAASGPTEEILLRSFAGMQILVYNGSAWTNAWETATGLPQAARICLQFELPSGPRTVTSETLIPAGHRIQTATQTGPGSNRQPAAAGSPFNR